MTLATKTSVTFIRLGTVALAVGLAVAKLTPLGEKLLGLRRWYEG